LIVIDRASIPLTYPRTRPGKLAAIKVIECSDVDYETAKKEVAGYFQMKGEAYASDASTDLQLDYELICKIMDDLEKEGKMEAANERLRDRRLDSRSQDHN
jgi:hypothetical protein